MAERPTEKAACEMDPTILATFDHSNGLRITDIGEDGDTVVLGHHEPSVVWAAFAARNVASGNWATVEDEVIDDYNLRTEWAAFSEHSEGCEDESCECEQDEVCAECRTLQHEACDGSGCLCADDYEHDRPAEWPCSCECYCDEYAWWMVATTSGHPVTYISFDYAAHRARSEQRTRPGATGGGSDA